MLSRYTQRNLVWIDLVHPSTAEVKQLMDEFHLDPLIADELLVPSFKPKVERRGDAIYLILHFPAPRVIGQRPEQEIDFVIGKNFLITTRYDHIDPLHAFAKSFEVQSVLGRGHSAHGGHLFAALAHSLYQTVTNECDALRNKLDLIEDRIFDGHEKQMVVALSEVGRTIHDYRQAMVPHREMLMSLEPASVRMFDQGFSYWVREVIGAYERATGTLEHLRDALGELRDTNDSLLSTKQNEIMRTFTVISFLFLPLTFIAAIFTMSTSHTPIVGSVNDFWIVVGIMTVVAVGCLSYFKYKNWL